MDKLQDWGYGKRMMMVGDTQQAGEPESPAILRPSLFLSPLMEVSPGKGGDLNGVSRE